MHLYKGFRAKRVTCTYIKGEQSKEINVRYLVIDSFSYCNIIIGRPNFNQLGVALSNLNLCMKYPLSDGQVGFVQGDQAISRKCYVESLKLKRI